MRQPESWSNITRFSLPMGSFGSAVCFMGVGKKQSNIEELQSKLARPKNVIAFVDICFVLRFFFLFHSPRRAKPSLAALRPVQFVHLEHHAPLLLPQDNLRDAAGQAEVRRVDVGLPERDQYVAAVVGVDDADGIGHGIVGFGNGRAGHDLDVVPGRRSNLETGIVELDAGLVKRLRQGHDGQIVPHIVVVHLGGYDRVRSDPANVHKVQIAVIDGHFGRDESGLF